MRPGNNVILKMRSIVKDFPGTRALDHVDFDVRAGEVHGLVGENGAGKSTLMNVLAGRFGDYTGEIIFDGREVAVKTPHQARDMGIAVIYQELRVLRNLTVAENIMLGEERVKRWTRRMDRSYIRQEANRVLERLGFDLDPDEPVQALGTARQCLVEIAGAVRRNAKLFVFDEPTASLGAEDVDKLFEVIRELKGRGLGIAYISHRLAEMPVIADRVTVLRDGRKVGTKDIARCSVPVMSDMMLGHSLSEMFPKKTNRPGKCILKVDGLTRPGCFEDISFELREGEVLGIAGLVGSGRTEIVRAIFGADKARGVVELDGKAFWARSPNQCCNRGIGMVQEDRKTESNITGRTVAENLNISILKRLSGALGFQRPRLLSDQARRMIDLMKIDPPNPSSEIQKLSGGNQQKVAVGRWLAAEPKVLIFDEPTQGIDIGTKAQMYKLIIELASEGRGIILVSSELIEIAKLSDRILIIRDGRIAGEMPGPIDDADLLFDRCVGKERAT